MMHHIKYTFPTSQMKRQLVGCTGNKVTNWDSQSLEYAYPSCKPKLQFVSLLQHIGFPLFYIEIKQSIKHDKSNTMINP